MHVKRTCRGRLCCRHLNSSVILEWGFGFILEKALPSKVRYIRVQREESCEGNVEGKKNQWENRSKKGREKSGDCRKETSWSLFSKRSLFLFFFF